jgi:hypothetical protein
MTTPDNSQIPAENHGPDILTGDMTEQYFPENHPLVRANLVSNAIKYTQAGKVLINVGLEGVDHDQASLRITVEDTGVGIPAHKLEHIFDVYEQVEARRDAGTGTGLGLSIFKHLVEMQGGTVFVKSMPGLGSIFGFTLKFGLDRQAPRLTPASKNFSTLLSLLGPVNLLLVDDDGMNIFIALKYLEICDNIRVTTAETTPHEDLARAGINACLLKPFTRDDLYKVIYEEMLRHQTMQIH